ncbi:DoxX family protein [Mucilaginibacter koreensis]
MKKLNALYWSLTGLFAFVMLGSAIPNILMVEMSVKGFAEISLPAYLLPFLGVAKALGVIAILVPGLPRLKEWAYAGLTFDLIGAIYCVAASGKPASNWAPMFIFIALAAGAYIVYHKREKTRLQAKVAAPAEPGSLSYNLV